MDFVASGQQAAGSPRIEGKPGLTRKALLLGTSLFVYAIAPSPAFAFAGEQCGPAPAGPGTVHCTPAGNPYPTGIDYGPTPDDLTIVLDPGVVTVQGVQLTSTAPDADLRVEGPVYTSIYATLPGVEGVLVTSPNGSAYVNVDHATTLGDNAIGISAAAQKFTTVIADTVLTSGKSSDGINASTSPTTYAGGPVSVTVADLTTIGDYSRGIVATGNSSSGHAGGDVTVDAGNVSTYGLLATGIVATSGTDSSGYSGNVTISADRIFTAGDHSWGIDARAGSGTLTINSGDITTHGYQGVGISAYTRSGPILITSTGTVTTTQGESTGISASSRGGPIEVTSANVVTSGSYGDGIQSTLNGDFGVSVIHSGSVATSGDHSRGIDTEARNAGSLTVYS
ncbi:MAG: hypothetical protein QOH86_1661, partial [Sphingomonadales bacterium]|nr:hypothetical protein [Sphingomonadales bacterium]